VNRIGETTIGREAIFRSAHFGELAAFFVRVSPMGGNCDPAEALRVFARESPKGQILRTAQQGMRSRSAENSS
jgi:hypothetical protein